MLSLAIHRHRKSGVTSNEPAMDGGFYQEAKTVPVEHDHAGAPPAMAAA